MQKGRVAWTQVKKEVSCHSQGPHPARAHAECPASVRSSGYCTPPTDHMRLLQLVTMSAHVACHPMHDGRPSRGALSRLAIGHPLGLARLPCTSIAVDMVRAPVCGQALAWYLLPRAPRTDAYACSIAKLRVYADRHVAWHARRCAASAEGLATSLRRYERAGLLGTDETADAALQAALVQTSVRLDSARYGESV